MNQLDQLRQTTTVVADTGNFLQLAQFRPQDAMATEKLAEDARAFAADIVKLETQIEAAQ